MMKQTYNKKIDAWVKYKTSKSGSVIVGVKKKNPTIPFSGVNILPNKKK